MVCDHFYPGDHSFRVHTNGNFYGSFVSPLSGFNIGCKKSKTHQCPAVGLRINLVGLIVGRISFLLEEGKPLRDAIYQGSMERLSPILMTALTTGLALIPLVLAGQESGNEIQAPLAIVVLGGLLSSTFLNMVVIPALCLRFYPER